MAHEPRMIAPYLPPSLPPRLPFVLSPPPPTAPAKLTPTPPRSLLSHLTLCITIGGYLLFHYADEVTHPVSPSARPIVELR